MNICDELREIRERQSLIVAKMTFEETKEYFRKGADAMRRELDEKRKKKIEDNRHKKKRNSE